MIVGNMQREMCEIFRTWPQGHRAGGIQAGEELHGATCEREVAESAFHLKVWVHGQRQPKGLGEECLRRQLHSESSLVVLMSYFVFSTTIADFHARLGKHTQHEVACTTPQAHRRTLHRLVHIPATCADAKVGVMTRASQNI